MNLVLCLKGRKALFVNNQVRSKRIVQIQNGKMSKELLLLVVMTPKFHNY